MQDDLSLWWLRRDLRLHDNLSLYMALQHSHKVQPIFIFDKHILSRFKNPNDRRISFILKTLRNLNEILKKQNSEILVFYGKPEELLPKIAKALKVSKVFAGKDYEPYGIARDNLVAREVNLILHNDHLLMAPDKILKKDNSPYKVFTPYLKQWNSLISPTDYGDYSVDYNNKFATDKKHIMAEHGLETLDLKNDIPGYKYDSLKAWPLDNLEERLNDFIDHKIADYDVKRDFLNDDGTSILSPYLRFGQISIRQCYRANMDAKVNTRWISELAWRDFYAMILYHFPETITQEMQPQYRKLQWSRDKVLFDKFANAQTGFPIIDAAINELLRTGWMHNRARMIVASFMTKNLWLDWRLGEEFFAQHLMDYELSSNVGGWQWSASTGTDAQPYFRIFNPYLQAKRFDPDAAYIKKYLPALKAVSPKEIHKPGVLSVSNYCAPVVDYELTRNKAIKSFRNISLGKA